MRGLPLWLALCLPLTASAHHSWGGIDPCETYQDRLPPGLTRAALPEPESPGAALLAHYCTQCHNLPGPDRHSNGEWRELLPKMFLLMDLSHRFGGLMGRVEALSKPEQAQLLGYLERHAGQIGGAAAATQSQTALSGSTPIPEFSRLWPLLPLLLLTALGLFRWWRQMRHA